VSLERVEDAGDLRKRVRAWRMAGERVAFVPTMGNLHAGHLALIRQARALRARVVCSIFVNPTQFGPNEDYSRYPRTLEDDAAALQREACDLLFLPDVDTLYPSGIEAAVRVEVPGLSDILCGAFRPGHFAGVAAVVARLFNLVQPGHAVFGSKDFQQLAVIRRLTRDLAFPIQIHSGATVREADGLAMSSRNQYLQPAERSTAARIFSTLSALRDRARGGESLAELEAWGRSELEAAGFQVDYVALRPAGDLTRTAAAGRLASGVWVALIAARLGATRLIDNLEFELGGR
jgi:pantoate--beta-alanine ligase